eukprot:14558752-Ditylum_brightwellii.AAC.2
MLTNICITSKAAASGATPPAVAQGGQVTLILPDANSSGQAASSLTPPVGMVDTPAGGTAASTPSTPSNRVGILQWSGASF